MENNNENLKEKNGFSYTYSAKERDELKRIREKYLPKEENKMEFLRKLDAGVVYKARTISIILGVLGALILGFGMSMCMTSFGTAIVPNAEISVIVGIVIGVIGGILAAIAYPIYSTVLKRERKRIAPEIIRLTDELMK